MVTNTRRQWKSLSLFHWLCFLIWAQSIMKNDANFGHKAMLRLRVTAHAITCRRLAGSGQPQLQRRQFVLCVHSLRLPVSLRLRGTVIAKALKDEANGGMGGFAGQSWDPGAEIEVPFEQRPVNEYSSLKNSTLYSWGELSPQSFFLRLGGLWLVTFMVLGAPIAAASFNPSKDPVRFGLAAGIGTLFLVSLIVLRIYLGWSYVGDRLLSAVIPYEETGWYDGQMWVKPPEVLARDRLLGSYKVKPVIKLLKQTLVGTGVVLVTAISLFIFASPVEDFMRSMFKSNLNEMPASKVKPNLRKDELLRLPAEVRKDDDLAAAAAEAADGRPVYCRDRFYRALAGGQYCSVPLGLKPRCLKKCRTESCLESHGYPLSGDHPYGFIKQCVKTRDLGGGF